jgi:hypothetical protein
MPTSPEVTTWLASLSGAATTILGFLTGLFADRLRLLEVPEILAG